MIINEFSFILQRKTYSNCENTASQVHKLFSRFICLLYDLNYLQFWTMLKLLFLGWLRKERRWLKSVCLKLMKMSKLVNATEGEVQDANVIVRRFIIALLNSWDLRFLFTWCVWFLTFANYMQLWALLPHVKKWQKKRMSKIKG